MNGIFGGTVEKDESYIRAAIDALSYSEDIDNSVLARRVFALAKTSYALLSAIDGKPSEILDAIFSNDPGKLADMTVVRSEGANIPHKDISVGDILVFDGERCSGILVFDGKDFVSLADGGRADSTYSSAKRFSILRPTRILTPVRDDGRTEELSEAQIALLATAEAYFMRGYRVQYDDSRFTRVGGGEFRWQIGLRNPEDYTMDRWGYINCAAFTYELYRTALGLDLGSLYTTHNLMSHYSRCGYSENEPMYPFYYVPDIKADEAERARVEAEFFRTLRVGDLVIIRRNNGNGHVLMYIGNGRFVHSSGSSYNYADSMETHEPTVMIIGAWEYLFKPTAKNYIFEQSGFITQLGIVRPLDKFSGEIPENTRNRVKNMRGIFAEKLSSVKGAQTVGEGSEITYTFKIKNLTELPRRIDIRDTVPTGTEFVFGDLTRTGEQLSACVALAACECREISYTVRVLHDHLDKICDTGATVGGVKHACGDILVRKTLSPKVREVIASAAESFIGAQDKCAFGAELINKIYVSAGAVSLFDSTDVADIESELFVAEEFYVFRADGKYVSMIPHGLYGGRNLQTENRYTESCKDSSDRVRLPRAHDLLIGDVVFLKGCVGTEFYLYTGKDRLLNLTNGAEWDSIDVKSRLEGLIGTHNYFVILRP